MPCAHLGWDGVFGWRGSVWAYGVSCWDCCVRVESPNTSSPRPSIVEHAIYVDRRIDYQPFPLADYYSPFEQQVLGIAFPSDAGIRHGAGFGRLI